MLRTLLALALLALPLAAAADELEFFGMTTGYVDGLGRVDIKKNEDGTLTVTHDPNKCAPVGSCTRRANREYRVETKVENTPDWDIVRISDTLSIEIGAPEFGSRINRVSLIRERVVHLDTELTQTDRKAYALYPIVYVVRKPTTPVTTPTGVKQGSM